MVDIISNTAAAGTNHFASIRLEAFWSGGAYKSLRGGEETWE